jgi:hydroxymethylpyrimidine/phosphomethylpyrimidine kinase
VAQIDALADDLPPAAFKTGMLATARLVAAVADAVRRHGLPRYVMDPVMVATSGGRLLERAAERSLRDDLLPLATVVTPNLEEAAILSEMTVESLDDMAAAARRIVELGASAALVKGGHLRGDAVDLLWDGVEQRLWRRPRIETRHTHGTGCTLSAGIAAGLARGDDLVRSVDRATRFVGRAIAAAPGLGQGRGPVNHFVPVD